MTNSELVEKALKYDQEGGFKDFSKSYDLTGENVTISQVQNYDSNRYIEKQLREQNQLSNEALGMLDKIYNKPVYQTDIPADGLARIVKKMIEGNKETNFNQFIR
jgi:hypothetical protein